MLEASIFEQILKTGERSDSIDDANFDLITVSGPMQSRQGKGLNLGLPDFIGIVNRRLHDVPFMETHSFEVKVDIGATREAIFQALAQRSLGIYSHSWLVVVLDRENTAVEEIKRECLREGIGLIVIPSIVNHEEMDSVLSDLIWPKRAAIEPQRQYEQMNQFGLWSEIQELTGYQSASES